MLGRRDIVLAVAVAAGMVCAAPVAAQTEFDDDIVLVDDHGYPGPKSMWIFHGDVSQFSLGHSAHNAIDPNPVITRTPFVVLPGARNSSLVVGANGIGTGTENPEASVHVLGTEGKAQIRVEETGGRVTPRNLLQLINGGPTTVRLENRVSGQAWTFGTSLFGGFYFGSTSGLATSLLLSPSGDLTIGGTLTQGSDRNSKQAIEPVDGASLLERVASLPLATWEYKDAAGVRHLGPMAQDFSAAFGLGADDKHIAPGDAAGVSLAAIQALKAENDELRARLAALEAQVSALGKH
jgi:hypothetical protein